MSEITIKPTTAKATCHTHRCRNKMRWVVHAKNAPPNTGLMLCDECLDSTLEALLLLKGMDAPEHVACEATIPVDYRAMFNQIGEDFEQGLLSVEDTIALTGLMDRIASKTLLPFEPEDVSPGFDTVDDGPVEEDVAGLPPVAVDTYSEAEDVQDIDKSVENENNEDEATTSLGGETEIAPSASPPAPKKSTKPSAKKKAPAKKSGGKK